MSDPTALLPFQPATMSTAQQDAVSYLARYAGRTHALYAYQLKQWSGWCQSNGLDPLVGIERAHVEPYIRQLGERPLVDSSVNTMMQGLDQLELIRFLQVSQTSLSTTAPWPTCWASTPCVRPRPPR